MSQTCSSAIAGDFCPYSILGIESQSETSAHSISVIKSHVILARRRTRLVCAIFTVRYLPVTTLVGDADNEVSGPGSRDWSSFGPTVVTMRDAEMAVITGSPDKALRIAARVPAPRRPTNTHQRFRLDVAAALLDQRDRQEATAVLLELRAVALNWLRHQRYAKSITGRLLRATPRAVSQELRDLADFLQISS